MKHRVSFRSPTGRRARPSPGERGIGLFEVIAGTLVATLAVLGLAYSFGIGRALIDRYLLARRAMARAQLLVDSLVTVPPVQLSDGNQPLWVDGAAAGTAYWTIQPVDDPIDGVSPADPTPVDEKRILVRVGWQMGPASDTLRLSRMVLP